MTTNMIHHNKNGQINIVLGEPRPKQETREITHEKNGPFKYVYDHFSAFIGMNTLKNTIREIYAIHYMNQKRKTHGMNCQKQVLHMFFKGNPGTGKTTVARKLAELYFQMNLLSKGHFIEAERADLVGEYIGQTAQKTRALIQKAQGGILFIDEAYALARGGEKDFGKEAIDTLVTHMEDNSDDFVLILAGYPEEMEHFLRLNPGLKSRFPFILDFDDYPVDDLMAIAGQMVRERDYILTPGAEERLREHLTNKLHAHVRHFSNARYVRNVLEEAIRQQAVRLLCAGTDKPADLLYIEEADLQTGFYKD